MDSPDEQPLENTDSPPVRSIAFAGNRRVASGPIREVASKVKKLLDQGEKAPILIFDDTSSELIEVDFRGTAADVQRRLSRRSDPPMPPRERRGPGRPRLGVVGREVTLLPRHWDWLDEQPGGASVVLRKLVEFAKRENREKDRARRSQEAAHRFMTAMAGNLPGFEEASRAFYGGDQERFGALIRLWPRDIREQVKKLVAAAIRDQAAAREKTTFKKEHPLSLFREPVAPIHEKAGAAARPSAALGTEAARSHHRSGAGSRRA